MLCANVPQVNGAVLEQVLSYSYDPPSQTVNTSLDWAACAACAGDPASAISAAAAAISSGRRTCRMLHPFVSRDDCAEPGVGKATAAINLPSSARLRLPNVHRLITSCSKDACLRACYTCV